MRWHFNLAVRMVLAIVVVSAVEAFAAFAAHSALTDAALKEVETQRAASLRRAIAAEAEETVKRLTIAARLLALHPPLIDAAANTAAADERRARVAPLLDKFLPLLDASLLEVVDHERRVIYRAHAPAAFGDVQSIWGLDEALAGKVIAVSAAGRAGLALRVMAPLGAGAAPAAALSVGILLDDRFARAVSNDVGAQVALLSSKGEVLAASLPHAEVAALLEPDSVAKSLRDKGRHVVGRALDGRTSVLFSETLLDQSYVWLVAVDSRYAEAQAAAARSAALRVSLLIAALSATLLGWLAHRHAARLRALQTEAEQTVLGLDIEALPALTGGDEIAALAGATRSMSARLQAHAEELRLARDAADAANAAKSSFLAQMSHEIRTPMSGVLGMAELLHATPLSQKQHQYLELMRQSGRSMLALLDGVLDLSKIEAGRLELEALPFDPRQTVQAGVDLMAPLAARKGLALSLSLSPQTDGGSSEQQLGDPLRLQQVLHNLLANAIKFTDSGGVRVAFGMAPELGTGFWRLAVTDTGCGIAPEALERLFQPFVQADRSTTRRHGGSGLGLMIARRIVEAMGGSLSVASDAGRGSTFTATFALEPLPAAAAPTSAPPGATDRPAATPAEPSLHSIPARRVLLVEDHPVSQRYGQTLLAQLGQQVDVADNGLHAVQMAGQTRHDLILMDLHMPLLDGYDATRQIRDIEATRGEPRRWIVALTANARPEERQRCLDAGMDAVMTKPYTRAQMEALLMRGPARSPAPA